MDNPFRDAGVSDEELQAAIDSPEVSEAKIALAEKCNEYWQAICLPNSRTGRYYNSIRVEVTDAVRVIAGGEEYGVDYAGYLEYGTGGDSPTPERAYRAQVESRFADRGE